MPTANEAKKWFFFQWNDKIKYARPSSGGATGVIFCWCSAPSPFEGGADYSKPKTADFVIKPSDQGGASNKFGEVMTARIAHAHSLNTEVIEPGSMVGKAITGVLTRFCNRADIGSPARQRWDRVLSFCRIAKVYLIQETLPNLTAEFGDLERETGPGKGLRTLLRDRTLMQNLGKMFVADAMVGNGDRLCNPNSGNIMFNLWNGRLWAVDTAAVLTNYNAMLNDVTVASWTNGFEFDGTPTPDAYVKMIAKDGGNSIPSKKEAQRSAQGFSARTTPGFGMNVLFDVNRWWDVTFRPHLEDALKREAQLNATKVPPEQPPVMPRPHEWNEALGWFREGVHDAMAEVDRLLIGKDWTGVKKTYQFFTRKFGGDPNLDWTNIKIRRMYYLYRRQHFTNEEALKKCQEFANQKLG